MFFCHKKIIIENCVFKYAFEWNQTEGITKRIEEKCFGGLLETFTVSCRDI